MPNHTCHLGIPEHIMLPHWWNSRNHHRSEWNWDKSRSQHHFLLAELWIKVKWFHLDAPVFEHRLYRYLVRNKIAVAFYVKLSGTLGHSNDRNAVQKGFQAFVHLWANDIVLVELMLVAQWIWETVMAKIVIAIPGISRSV